MWSPEDEPTQHAAHHQEKSDQRPTEQPNADQPGVDQLEAGQWAIAHRHGHGAVGLNGMMLDEAVAVAARRTLARAGGA